MIRLGIVAALRRETDPLTRKAVAPSTVVPLSSHASLILAGMGADRARAAGRRLLEAGAGALLSWGTAGALDPRLAAGDLVITEQIVDREGRRLPVDNPWRQQLLMRIPPALHVDPGPIGETPQVIATATDKQRLYMKSGCRAVDMESAALARLAQESGVPFLAVRVIVDSATQTLPPAILEALNEYGEVAVGRLLKALLVRPQIVAALISLARSFRAARRSLQQVAPCATSGFPGS